MLSSLEIFSHLILTLQLPWEVGAIIILILLLRKSRQTAVKWLAQGHPTGKWLKLNLNSSLLDSRSSTLSTVLKTCRNLIMPNPVFHNIYSSLSHYSTWNSSLLFLFFPKPQFFLPEFKWHLFLLWLSLTSTFWICLFNQKPTRRV